VQAKGRIKGTTEWTLKSDAAGRGASAAAEQPYIDSRQIIVWGTSFAGMHVLELAVSDTRLAAAIAQAPLTDGLAAAMMSPPKNGIRLFGLALLDQLGSLIGRQPIYIPGHARPGELSIGATPGWPVRGEAHDPEGWDAMA
jgi:Prolyl oligopeptidase family